MYICLFCLLLSSSHYNNIYIYGCVFTQTAMLPPWYVAYKAPSLHFIPFILLAHPLSMTPFHHHATHYFKNVLRNRWSLCVSMCLHPVTYLLVLFTSYATINRSLSLSPLWLCQPGLSCWWKPVTGCPILAWWEGHRVCLSGPTDLWYSPGFAGHSMGSFLKVGPQKGYPLLCHCHWITAQGVGKLWFCAYWREKHKKKRQSWHTGLNARLELFYFSNFNFRVFIMSGVCLTAK